MRKTENEAERNRLGKHLTCPFTYKGKKCWAGVETRERG